MVKLTPELINSSMQYMNPCRDRELDLRGKNNFKRFSLKTISIKFPKFTLISGYKIPQIENMGATLDQFDTVDFSDNDIRKLGGFPFLARLKCLLLNNNRIT